MKLPEEGKLLKIFVGETDKHDGKSLYEAIVLKARDLNLGLIFIVSMGSVNIMALLVAGWGSNNKYSMFGAMRAVAQSIAFEIPILLSMLAVVFMCNTFSLKEIVGAQEKISVYLLF